MSVATNTLDWVLNHTTEVDLETIVEHFDVTDCDSFEELRSTFAEALHVNEQLEQVLACMLAVALSTRIPGNPLWFYVVGPASSGKSTLAECLGAHKEICISRSKLTGLVSGWKSKDGEDASPIKQLRDKCLILKDFTSTISSSPGAVSSLFGELREAYDGEISATYRNTISRQYKGIRFTLIACTTGVIAGFNNTSLGERFLKINLDLSKSDARTRARSAIDTALEVMQNPQDEDVANPHLQVCMATTAGYLESALSRVNEEGLNISLPDSFKDYITDLSEWIAASRAQVKRESGGDKDLLYRPEVEVSSRLSTQLARLAVMLCVVYNVREPDFRIRKIIRTVANDTGRGFQLEVLTKIAITEDGCTNEMLHRQCRLSESSAHRTTSNLRELKVLSRRKEPNKFGKGKHAGYFLLAPHYRRVFDNIHAYETKFIQANQKDTSKEKQTSTRKSRARKTKANPKKK